MIMVVNMLLAWSNLIYFLARLRVKSYPRYSHCNVDNLLNILVLLLVILESCAIEDINDLIVYI